MRRCSLLAALALVMGVCACALGQSITSGQVDDFPAFDTLNWQMGHDGDPTTVSSGGPQGANDPYLQVISSGAGMVMFSNMVFYNDFQWTGNYIAAGVTGVTAQMCDFGPAPLSMRITIQDDFGSEYGSATAFSLPADSQWHAVTFDLSPSGLSLIQGGSSYTHALSNVGTFRILSASAGPSFFGDKVQATLGVDEIAAVPEPGAIFLMLGALGLLCFRRVRAPG